MKLSEMDLIPCKDEEPRMTDQEIAEMLLQLPDWEVMEMDGIPRLTRTYELKQYAQGLAAVQALGELGEKQDHHPLVTLSYKRLTITWWTNVVDGLQMNDFISAAKSAVIAEEALGGAVS